MNDHKIAFIICTNDEFYMSECRLYLSHLRVPAGFETELLEIHDAASMTAGYNEAMAASDAKFKIYMHQDVYITNPDFLQHILDIFTDKAIGMIGLVGSPRMPQDAVMWHDVRVGGFYRLEEYTKDHPDCLLKPLHEGTMSVEAVDGLLMATQYDIPWRDDILKKWDFYDVSQSMEFRRRGYQVVVAGQNPAWYIHHCGELNMDNYESQRQIVLKEYGDMIG